MGPAFAAAIPKDARRLFSVLSDRSASTRFGFLYRLRHRLDRQ